MIDGPCYDYCSCADCWNGWVRIPFWRRLLWRVQYVLGGGGR